MTDHATISPSSIHRTVACPGWIRQAALVPPTPPDDSTLEGDAAHWVALVGALNPAELSSLVGMTAPNGQTITDEMTDGAALYVDALEGLPGAMEERVAIPRVHPTECWGTPDRFDWSPATKTLRVIDYKFGHLFVEVFENWQLIAYACGIMDKLGLADQDVILHLTIVQPRSYHRDGPIRTWRVSATKLRAMINDMHAAAHEALTDKPRTQSGPHCVHCPARVSCSTLQQTTGNILDFAGRADPLLQTPEDIGRELRLVTVARERLKARQTGLEAQAEALLRAGRSVPFFMLEPGQSRLRWLESVSVAEVEAAAQALTGRSVLKPPALITPTQAIKAKAFDGTVISQYSERPPGAMKLVADTTAKARKVFST